MNNESTKTSPWGAILITSIICLTVITVTVFGLALTYNNWATNPKPQQEVNTVLQAVSTVLVAFLTGIIGAGFGGYKLYKKLNTQQQTLKKVEEQTNGRTHLRDAQIDALIAQNAVLVSKLEGGTNTSPLSIKATEKASKAAAMPHEAEFPPEDTFSVEEIRLTKQLAEVAKKLSKLRDDKNKDEEGDN